MSNITNIKGFTVNQLTTKPIAMATIPFAILRKIVKFTYREPQNYDPFNPIKSIDEIEIDINQSYYQRLTDDKRISNIYNFLLKEIDNIHSGKNATGTFPTSIIIGLDINLEVETEEEYNTYIQTENINESIGAFYKKINEKDIELLIPTKKVSLIVDGQHRLSAMIKLFEDAKNGKIKIGRSSLEVSYPNITEEIVMDKLNLFDLNCTILLGFDKWEQGKVFADVNFNQKPVNKSLYYDIFGSYPDPNKNDIFLAHMLAMHLNNADDSVIKGFIKMLGSGKGYFSQAFFVEAILGHFSRSGIWGAMPMDYINGGNEYKVLPKFLKAYFKAVKNVFGEYWPKDGEDTSRKYPHILVKTTGMGALIKLISPIYKNVKVTTDLNSISQRELTQTMMIELNKAKDKGAEFFSSKGDFAGAGSLGLQDKLFKAFALELGYHK